MTKSIPLVDLGAQRDAIGAKIDERVATALSAGQYILGPEVRELEQRLEAFCGVEHAVSCANGTDALTIPLKAYGIGPGDAVFVPPFTFVATAEVVADLGASPVFVDIDPDTFNLSPKELAAAVDATLSAGQLRPRAVIPVDLFGLPADYPAIEPIARDHDLLVIADAAQSMGAQISERRTGSLTSVSATSFYPAKPLGCYGDGGCMFTTDDELADRLRMIRGHGLDPATGDAQVIGLNSRLDTLQATILLAKLDVFASEIEQRQIVAGWYDERLGAHVRTPQVPSDFVSAWAVYSILSPARDAIRAALTAANIASAVYYARPLHLHPAYAEFSGGPGSLPVCEGLGREIIALPMSPYLDEETVDRICRVVIDALS